MKRSMLASFIFLVSVVFGKNLVGAGRENCFSLSTQVAVPKDESMGYQDFENQVKSAWYLYGESGCRPEIRLVTVSRVEDVFSSQGELLTHLIKKDIGGKYRDSNFISGHTIGCSIVPFMNNCFTLKQSNGNWDAIRIDDRYMDEDRGFNNIMTIYSIGQNSGPLRQEELDTFINNKIEKPLIIVLERGLLDDKTVTNMLLKQFEKLGGESNPMVRTYALTTPILRKI